MLSFEEVNRIVTKNLDCLAPETYEVVYVDRGTSILYTITMKQSGKLLGRYRVEKQPNGSVSYGSIQGNGPEWDLIWECMLNRTIIRADGKMTETLEQEYQRRQEVYLKLIQEQDEQNKVKDNYQIIGHIDATKITFADVADTLKRVTDWISKPSNNGNIAQIDATVLPKIDDPTDQRIWEYIKKNPAITDTALAQKLGNMTRQAVNNRRRALEKMGYPVRKVSRQNK